MADPNSSGSFAGEHISQTAPIINATFEITATFVITAATATAFAEVSAAA